MRKHREHPEQQDGQVGRRSVLTAVLAGAAAATVSGTSSGAAPGSASNVRSVGSEASPVTATIASNPLPGFIYRTFTYIDFLPLNPAASARTFGGSGGMYAAGVMQASVEIPAGALLRDMEWYVANSSGSNALFSVYIWTPADGYITSIAFTTIPSGSGAPAAVRTVIPSSGYGPYPAGSKLYLYAPTSSSVLLNGVRLGFSGGGAEVGVRPTPLKVYDSVETGGKYAANQTRTVTLAAVAAGTTAAVLRITSTASTLNGQCKVYAANQPLPDVSSLTYIRALQTVGEATVTLPPNRQVKITVTAPTHIRLDLVATFR